MRDTLAPTRTTTLLTGPIWSERRAGIHWVVAVSTLELVVVVSRVGGPVAVLASVVFVLTCPGALLLDVVEPVGFGERLMLAVAASLSANVIAATVVALSWLGLALAVGGITIAYVVHRSRSRRGGP